MQCACTPFQDSPVSDINPTTTQNSVPPFSTNTQIPVSETPGLCDTDTTADEDETQDSFIANHVVLLLLMLLLSVVVLGLTLVTVWVFCCREGRCCRHRSSQGRGKYKAVGKFFIPLLGGGSDGKVVSIAIPEIGVPNAMPSEREKLLVESDEEEV